MKKITNKILVIVMILVTILPVYVLAANKQSGTTQGGPGLGSSTNTWQRHGSATVGGVRLTFIDQDGKALINKSFDFVTGDNKNTGMPTNPSPSNVTVLYNNYSQAKGKVQMANGGAWKSDKKKLSSYPTISELYNKYLSIFNKKIQEEKKCTKAKKDAKKCTTPYTDAYPNNADELKKNLVLYPGHISNDAGKYGYKYENNWLKSISGEYLATKTASARMSVFMEALSNVVYTPGSKNQKQLNNDLQKLLKANCRNEMFLETDAMAFAIEGNSNGSYYLLTLTDMYHVGATWGLLDATPSSLYYPTKIGDFKGFSPTSTPHVYSSASSLLDSAKTGDGVALNWIRKSGSCSSCDCLINEDGKLECNEPNKNNKMTTNVYGNGKSDKSLTKSQQNTLDKAFKNNSAYPSLNKYAVYAFATEKQGGRNCCEEIKTDYEDMPKDFQKAYDNLCNGVTNTCADCRLDGRKLVCKEIVNSQVKEVTYTSNYSYNNKISAVMNNYPTLTKPAVYAFSTTKNGGKDCCSTFKKNYDSLPDDYKLAYNTICKNVTSTCEDCTYNNAKLVCKEVVNGKLKDIKYNSTYKFDSKLESTISTKYPSLAKHAAYAFMSTEDGGRNCCEQFSNEYNSGKFNNNWKKAYETICKNGPTTDKVTCDCVITDQKLVCSELDTNNKKQSITYGDGSTNVPETDALKTTLSKYSSLDKYAVYAFATEAEGGKDCCDQLKTYYYNDKMSSGFKKAYETMCPSTCDTVTDKPKEVDVNNCCTDSTKSKVEEYSLKELFCKDENLGIDYYTIKDGADSYYKDQDITLNSYCDLYCTEKVEVEVPGTITAISGRYFKLVKTSKGTSSPYIEGNRKCMVRIKYDQWEKDYKSNLTNQISKFNETQDNLALKKMYEDAKTESGTKSISITDGDGNNAGSCSISVTYAKFSDVTYTKAELDETSHKKLGIKFNTFTKTKLADVVTDYSSTDYSNCENKKSELGKKNPNKTYSVETITTVDLKKEIESYEGSASSARDQLKSYINTATNLKTYIDTCNNFFSKGGSVPASTPNDLTNDDWTRSSSTSETEDTSKTSEEKEPTESTMTETNPSTSTDTSSSPSITESDAAEKTLTEFDILEEKIIGEYNNVQALNAYSTMYEKGIKNAKEETSLTSVVCTDNKTVYKRYTCDVSYTLYPFSKYTQTYYQVSSGTSNFVGLFNGKVQYNTSLANKVKTDGVDMISNFNYNKCNDVIKKYETDEINCTREKLPVEDNMENVTSKYQYYTSGLTESKTNLKEYESEYLKLYKEKYKSSSYDKITNNTNEMKELEAKVIKALNNYQKNNTLATIYKKALKDEKTKTKTTEVECKNANGKVKLTKKCDIKYTLVPLSKYNNSSYLLATSIVGYNSTLDEVVVSSKSKATITATDDIYNLDTSDCDRIINKYGSKNVTCTRKTLSIEKNVADVKGTKNTYVSNAKRAWNNFSTYENQWIELYKKNNNINTNTTTDTTTDTNTSKNTKNASDNSLNRGSNYVNTKDMKELETKMILAYNEHQRLSTLVSLYNDGLKDKKDVTKETKVVCKNDKGSVEYSKKCNITYTLVPLSNVNYPSNERGYAYKEATTGIELVNGKIAYTIKSGTLPRVVANDKIYNIKDDECQQIIKNKSSNKLTCTREKLSIENSYEKVYEQKSKYEESATYQLNLKNQLENQWIELYKKNNKTTTKESSNKSENIFVKAGNTIVAGGKKIIDTVVSAGERVKSAVSNAVDNVVSFFKKEPSKKKTSNNNNNSSNNNNNSSNNNSNSNNSSNNNSNNTNNSSNSNSSSSNNNSNNSSNSSNNKAVSNNCDALSIQNCNNYSNCKQYNGSCRTVCSTITSSSVCNSKSYCYYNSSNKCVEGSSPQEKVEIPDCTKLSKATCTKGDNAKYCKLKLKLALPPKYYCVYKYPFGSNQSGYGLSSTNDIKAYVTPLIGSYQSDANIELVANSSSNVFTKLKKKNDDLVSKYNKYLEKNTYANIYKKAIDANTGSYISQKVNLTCTLGAQRSCTVKYKLALLGGYKTTYQTASGFTLVNDNVEPVLGEYKTIHVDSKVYDVDETECNDVIDKAKKDGIECTRPKTSHETQTGVDNVTGKATQYNKDANTAKNEYTTASNNFKKLYKQAVTELKSTYNSKEEKAAFAKVYDKAYSNKQSKSKNVAITCKDAKGSTKVSKKCSIKYDVIPLNKYSKNQKYNQMKDDSISIVNGQLKFSTVTSSFILDDVNIVTDESDCKNIENNNKGLTCTREKLANETTRKKYETTLSNYNNDYSTSNTNYQKYSSEWINIFGKTSNNSSSSNNGTTNTSPGTSETPNNSSTDNTDNNNSSSNSSNSSNTDTPQEVSNENQISDTSYPIEKVNETNNYILKPELKFYYTQAINNNGKAEMINTEIPFKPVDCNTSLVTSSSDLIGKQYSKVYGSGNIDVTSFNSDIFSSLSLLTSNPGVDTTNAEKLFSVDAKYNTVCSWEEDDSKSYTLVPSGLTVTTPPSTNTKTVHGRVYQISTSTLEGTYETHWSITGLGHKGRLDKYFQDGKTCSNGDPKDDGTFTCKIHIKNEIIKTGECNPNSKTDLNASNDKNTKATLLDNNYSNVTIKPIDNSLDDRDVCSNPDKSTINKEGSRQFNFKTVDEKSLFPQGTESNGKKYAQNWTETNSGQKVLKEIQETANQDKTYAPENLTYSFVFTPSGMKTIKKYNKSKDSQGGYLDFEFDCTCDANRGSCTKCKSRLLTDLASGKITIDGKDESVDIRWSNNELSLNNVRESNHW